MGLADLVQQGGSYKPKKPKKPKPPPPISGSVKAQITNPVSSAPGASSPPPAGGTSSPLPTPTRTAPQVSPDTYLTSVQAAASTPPTPEVNPTASPLEKQKARKELVAALQRKDAKAVPDFVPKQYRSAVVKYGKMLEPALKGTGISGANYLAHLIQFESNWNPTARNAESGAFGLGQFIDSTAQDFRSRLGVETQNPKDPVSMIRGAAMHASGKHGYGALYGGYNPGYSDTDPILKAAQNTQVEASGRPKNAIRRARNVLGAKTTQQILSDYRSQQPKTRTTPDIVKFGKIAQEKFGLTVGENPRFGGVEPVHTDGSFHYSGDAIDVTGDPKQLARFNRYVAKRYGDQIDEMFYDPGVNIDSGSVTGPIGGHGTHVHLAVSRPGGSAVGLTGAGSGGGAVAGGGGAVGGGALPGGGMTIRGRGATSREQTLFGNPSAGLTPIDTPLAAQANVPDPFNQQAQSEDEDNPLDPRSRLLKALKG